MKIEKIIETLERLLRDLYIKECNLTEKPIKIEAIEETINILGELIEQVNRCPFEPDTIQINWKKIK